MLVLTRRLGEAITIGDDIRIVVVDISGNQIKLGIDAPKDVEIYREELYKRIKGVSFGTISQKKKEHGGKK
ncbi:carbon storage regulator CsrA [Caldithrix abyssi]|uniref:Translational regulator CsrA n=1 Tax=Caldithrix abyssi DSM 13497 TaxID=880073 RepID=H1XWU8_CALAY|nr:carbon storage regulator CsrA [Caldithrix abyssi]APF19151.1 csrA carbon storage regulator, CsrA [Caldithrix abyssi DSM 13497]EHO43074.1 carbon storage regulator, CsrA [Caldithrix abyssi DSM 13497]